MTSTTVQSYSHAAAGLDDSYFLGQVVSFTITDADVDLDDLRTQIAAHNLRDDTLKKKLRPIDAFKKAANDVATKFPKMVDAQHSFMVRPVGQDAQESHRHIVFERAIFKVGQKRRVEHETVLKLIYNRGFRDKEGLITQDHVHVEDVFVPGLNLTAAEQAWLDQQVGKDGQHIRDRYEHYSTHLDSHGVRTFVREYLYLMGAINIKGNGGGLYFVQQKHAAELRDLSALVNSIGSQMHLIPLLDIVDQRDMLAEAFIQDTMDEVRQVSAEIGKILTEDSRTITEATYDAYVERSNKLIEKAREYQQLLDRNLDKADLELTVFQRKALNLVTRVRHPKSLSVAP